MSQNFSAEQYESAYDPKHLSQWEVPKKFRKFPRLIEGSTTCVTDENGRFLSGMKPSTSKKSSFEGTWGKDFARPGAAKGWSFKPGMWMIKGRQARWVEAVKIVS